MSVFCILLEGEGPLTLSLPHLPDNVRLVVDDYDVRLFDKRTKKGCST